MSESNDPEKPRRDFLLAMYGQMMNDINRHIIVIWQSVGALLGAFAVFALVEKQVIPIDVATSLIIVLAAWVIAHVYDAGYWYNRNLVIIANIERQFLRPTDKTEIHYYFVSHRKVGALITHLEIQLYFALGIAAVVLSFHFVSSVLPLFGDAKFSLLVLLPYLTLAALLWVWKWAKQKANARYKSFLENSPGKEVDRSGIKDGPGHPTA